MCVVGLVRDRSVGSIVLGFGGAAGGRRGFVMVLRVLNCEPQLIEGVGIAFLNYGVETWD
jgi:hypothetical protein